jgi:hypothetical protein
MTKELEAIIEAASTPAAKLEPGQWKDAFEDSREAVDGYLAAAPEFQNAKVDTFFIRFAVDTMMRDFKGDVAAMRARALLWLWIKKRRESFDALAAALMEFESIQRDLCAEFYDAATIERRLTDLERETKIKLPSYMTKLPSYVFTLLKRRAAAASLTPSAGSD